MKAVKLNLLNRNRLSDLAMNNVRAGEVKYTICCSCACKYANSGGSSRNANCSANDKGSLSSPGTQSLLNMSTKDLFNLQL